MEQARQQTLDHATTDPAGSCRRRSGRRGVRRRVVTAGAIVVLAASSYAGVIVAGAVTAAGDDTFTARLAESARDHGLGPVVTALEELQYQVSPARTGGRLTPAEARSLAASGSTVPTRPGAAGAAGPDRLRSLAGSPLPGEGVFVPTVRVGGRPAIEVARLRPDSAHPSYLTAVAWMDPRLLRFVQHPGAADPGQLARWTQPPTLTTTERAGLVATFNSGFKIADARGGYLADGHTVGALRPGAASLVVDRTGAVRIGAWGRDVSLTPDVVAVRQNLDLLVDGGRISPAVDARSRAAWGATVGAADAVWRSGIGVTAGGDLVYVAGDALTVHSLAAVLQDAGAVRAMELDINRSWISYMWYSSGAAGPVPHKLTDFARPANRYFGVSSRDFFAVYAR